MKFSICVPAFNASRTIEKLMESVFKQTYSDWELIIVDDNSSDNTVELARKYSDTRIHLFQNPRNLGLNANWNHTIAKANGEWVMLLGHDDFLYPQCLERLALVADNYEHLGIIAFNGYFEARGFTNRRKFHDFHLHSKMVEFYLPVLHVVPPSECVYNVKACREVGWLDTKYFYSPEMTLEFKIYLAGYNYFGVDEALVVRGKEVNSVSTNVNPYKVIKDRIRFLKDFGNNFRASKKLDFFARCFVDYLKLSSQKLFR